MFTMYDYFRSSSSFRVRLALNYKAIPYDKIKIDLLAGNQSTSEYKKINPAGLVPSLSIDGGQILHQSLAIIDYLDEEYPSPPLLPTGAFDRAYVRAISLDIACDIHPVNNVRVLNYLKNELQQDQEAVNKWYQHWIIQGLAAVEESIKTSSFYQNKYCYKEQFTIADLCLLPQLFNARRYYVDVDKRYPTLVSIEERCKQHDFILMAYPGEQ